MQNNDESNDKYFSEITDQEFSKVRTIVSAILESNSTKTIDKKTKGLIELIPEILITSGELKHSSKFKDTSFEDFIKSQTFKDLIVKSVENKFPADTIKSQEIEFLKSIIPATFYITNNKLSNEMTKDFINKGQIELAVIKSKKGEVITYNSLTYDDKNISIIGRYEFTAYDRAIHNAACSLYAAGNDIVTPAMVYRTVNGMITQEKVSPQALEAVFQSLYNSRFLKLIVDYTNEATARGIKGIDKFKIDSYLLPADVITVEAGGYKVEAFKFLKKPPLYEYAQFTGQIISVPLSILDTKEATRNTEDIIPIKEYLIRRIEIMRHDKTMSNKILYDTIFEEVGITISDQKQRNRLRSYITAILNLWKTRDKYIKDFKEYQEGRTFKGIKIVY